MNEGFEGFDQPLDAHVSDDQQTEELEQQQQTEEMAQEVPTEIINLDDQAVPEDIIDTASSQPKVQAEVNPASISQAVDTALTQELEATDE